MERTSRFQKNQNQKRVEKRRRKRPNRIVPMIVLVIGLFIVNNTNPLGFIFTERNYEETAEIMANFIVAEYNRQRAESPEGEVELKEIVKMAKRLDKTRGLLVSFSDKSYDTSFSISLEFDGGKFIHYKSVDLDE